MPIPDTTIRDGRERPTPASPLARARLVPSAFLRERKIELRSHRHHQHHTPCVAGQLERHETPDPVRSDAVKPRIQCVWPGIHTPGFARL